MIEFCGVMRRCWMHHDVCGMDLGVVGKISEECSDPI